MKAAFFCEWASNIDRVYASGRYQQVAALFDLHPTLVTQENLDSQLPLLGDLNVIFSTWGMFPLTEEQLDQLPNLKAVFYAAGTVKGFAEPYLRRGIQVVSAADANGEFVADYAAAQIQLAAKGYFHQLRVGGFNARAFHEAQHLSHPGIFGIRIGLIGAGLIGRRTIAKLRLPGLSLCVYDPYLSQEAAQQLGVESVSLEELFSTCQVVSNHAPNTAETQGMLKKKHFLSMPPASSFVNTGRGQTVDEPGMIEALIQRPDIVALLDVTYPEPPAEDSPLYRMANVYYTPHIAGALGNEVVHMANLCLEEAQRFLQGQPLRHAVSLERLKIMA